MRWDVLQELPLNPFPTYREIQGWEFSDLFCLVVRILLIANQMKADAILQEKLCPGKIVRKKEN